MIVYVDGLLFLNFFFDFLLLLTTSIILKRNVTIFRVMLGAFFGSLSILVLFFQINSFELFLIKLYLGFLMCIISFGYKNIKYFLTSMGTFYLVSIILGGFLYYLNLEFSYKHEGLIFYNKGPSINIVFLCIISPIILYLYIRQVKNYKSKVSNFYKVNLYIGRKVISLNGYLDSGNTLSFKGRMVIITNIKNIFKNKKYLVSYTSISGVNLLECIKVRKVEVIGIGEFENIFLGFSKSMNICGVDVLLNGNMEG
ncbi:MAG: sigma-E processing peptidase SpoIIGA [Bacilli bacterium]|nr:sigma-E processing peptidase SpoIIGA [Bacilli bacterium]